MPGKTNQIHVMFLQRCDDLAFVLFTIATAPFDSQHCDSTFFRKRESRSISLVANHHDDLSVWDNAIANGIAQRKHV